jgi:hypothetical protein
MIQTSHRVWIPFELLFLIVNVDFDRFNEYTDDGVMGYWIDEDMELQSNAKPRGAPCRTLD